MPFAALDVHKKETEAVLLNQAGQVLLRQRLGTDRDSLEAFARQHLREYSVALEATIAGPLPQ